MRISFIGAGNMAGAIIKSVISSGRVKASDVTVYDRHPEKRDIYAKLGAVSCDSLETACNASEFILLAVKPQDYEDLLLDIKNVCKNVKDKIFISVAAAISTCFICKTLGADCAVVRVMPNTPLLLGFGATAISRNGFVNDRDYTKICGLFAASGTVTVLDESLMNAVISVSGSSPMYVYLLAKAMIDNAKEQGIDEKAATDLVYQTIKGSAEMLLHTDKTPDELIRMVASPKGTTEAALKSFTDNDFCKVVSEAMIACTRRTEELGK